MNGHHPSRNAGPSYTVPLYDTTGLTSTLANPYIQHVSTHYYQAYVQACLRPRTTAEGYTLSSTYVPGAASQTNRAAPTITVLPLRDQPSAQAQLQPTVKPIRNHFTYGSWYQPGNSRCTRQGCPFVGSRRSVEIHMMDRHFIFPLGWKKKDDWDADPSLKGKLIAIQGTSLVLDTPEAINAWMAERKRRFPTEERIRDKKRKLEDAVAQGRLVPEDPGTRKKYRQNNTFAERGSKGFRGKGHQRGRDRRREGLAKREEPQASHVDDSTSREADAETERAEEVTPGSASTPDDDEAPEIVSSKVPTSSPCIPKVDGSYGREVQKSFVHAQRPRRTLQPKEPPRNPFASRSTLLRNLLSPEIRITVSNLSQTIRFLVENNFLCGVELRPGEAQEQMIEVLGSSETPCVYSSPEEPGKIGCEPSAV